MSYQVLGSEVVSVDEDGLVWLLDVDGSIVCEAFYRDVDHTYDEMLADGYIHWGSHNGEELWVKDWTK